MDALAPKVQHYGDKIADLATTRKVDSLPDRLTALWEEGVPLSGDPTVRIETPAERRAVIYEYWRTRTDTEWGDTVRQAVASFCRAVVQTSDAPFTPAELDAYEANHPERPFLRSRDHFPEGLP